MTGARVTVTFEKVRQGISKHGACPVCGGRVTRSRTFTETVNPYNRGPDGQPKTKGQIMLDLVKRAEAWVPDFRHERCRP